MVTSQRGIFGGGTGLGFQTRFRRNRNVFGVEHVNFEYVHGRTFDLMVRNRRVGDLLPLLRKVYPANLWDSRDL